MVLDTSNEILVTPRASSFVVKDCDPELSEDHPFL